MTKSIAATEITRNKVRLVYNSPRR